jgi:hypothetical protein
MKSLRALALVACLPAAAALAQQPDQVPPPPPPPPPAAEVPAAPETPPAPEAAPAEAAPAAPAADERLTAVEGKLEGMEEANAATNATVDALRKIKVSGYIQGRYEWHDDAAAGLDASNAARGTSRFLVRRGRLKTTYTGTMSEYLLQIDATPDGVVLKDAEASLVLDESVFPSPTPWELKLSLGQFKAPFGFEVLQSSGDREMPERTLMIRTFFPGERDRGARLSLRYSALRLQAGIINGNVFPAISTFSVNSASVKDPIAGSIDQSSYKDVLGRLGADLGFIVFGGSAYWGHTIATKAASGMTPASYTRFSRLRVGGDAQAYVDVPAVGGLVLRGEIIYGVEKNLSYAGLAADPCKDIKSLGWYATLVQNIGGNLGVVVRVDQFDRNRGVKDTCADSIKASANADRATTIGGGLLGYVSGNLKVSAIYEHLMEQGVAGTYKKDNDIFTLQLQAKF